MNRHLISMCVLGLVLGSVSLECPFVASAADGVPRSTDPRITVHLYAEHPQVVTPTGIAVDRQGRVFVAESHTHFRPDDYDGPPADRILVFEDNDGDGRADERAVFHEGLTHLMDIEFHPDGSLFVATRMDIHRMRDVDNDGKADEIIPIVRMETTGTYPHNGLSGLAFDFNGDLHFGLGENLGHAYTLVGTDGIRLHGGGEGGSTYHVQADGTKLRRISTGWWNPFGLCVDGFGRVFGTDNDPGASPPCRLIQVIEGGDYGYEYRYGRTGLHPLVTWTGDIPGTLPMVAGTGEAPCAVIAYESDALPNDYFGNLLIASWADHRIEHFPIVQQSGAGLVTTARRTLVEGDNEFRPVGLATAPDGTVYVSDWVSSSYELHKQGRIWRIGPTRSAARHHPGLPRQSLLAKDRTLRELAARQIVRTGDGRQQLREELAHSADSRVRAVALQALISVNDRNTNYCSVVEGDEELAIQVLALRHMLRHGVDPRPWIGAGVPRALQAEAAAHLDPTEHVQEALDSLRSTDPLVVHGAVIGLAKRIADDRLVFEQFAGQHAQGALLALRRSGHADSPFIYSAIERFLLSSDPQVRFLAVKWVADEQFGEFRGDLVHLLNDANLDYRLFLATCAALDRLDGKEPSDQPSPQLLLSKISDDDAPTAIRRLSLRLIDPTFKRLKVNDLVGLTRHDDPLLRLEAVRTLAAHYDERRFESLIHIARDHRQDVQLRATAVAGLAPAADRFATLLVDLAVAPDVTLRDESLRSLVGVVLPPDARQPLRQLGNRNPETKEAVQRILDGSHFDRAPASDTAAWLRLLDNAGDPQAGQRIFFGQKVGTCARCHQLEGRGTAAGPDLTMIGRRLAAQQTQGRHWLLETILEPSKEMAPQYTPWMIVTVDGRTLIGLPRRKGGNAEAYLGQDGKEFTIKKDQIEFHRETTKSIMPDDLLNNLTRQELCNLFAFLTQLPAT